MKIINLVVAFQLRIVRRVFLIRLIEMFLGRSTQNDKSKETFFSSQNKTFR